jgi:hypothetical protein
LRLSPTWPPLVTQASPQARSSLAEGTRLSCPPRKGQRNGASLHPADRARARVPADPSPPHPPQFCTRSSQAARPSGCTRRARGPRLSLQSPAQAPRSTRPCRDLRLGTPRSQPVPSTRGGPSAIDRSSTGASPLGGSRRGRKRKLFSLTESARATSRETQMISQHSAQDQDF